MLSCFSCISLFATLWTLAHQAPLFMGFSRQEYWSEFPCPPPGDLPDPGIKPYPLCLLHGRRVLCVTSTAWEALSSNNRLYFWLILEPPVKKINKKKPQLETVGRPEESALPESNNKKKDFSLLTRTQPMKSHALSVSSSPPSFLLPSVKAFSFPYLQGLAHGLTWLGTPNCNSWLFQRNPFSFKEITGNVLILGQHTLYSQDSN